jgi:hypothetical protein
LTLDLRFNSPSLRIASAVAQLVIVPSSKKKASDYTAMMVIGLGTPGF